ncbi:MAG: hypothetical protein EA338_08975 [Roseinatronobacter sp.]|nr:MAG: hypothetical protein EA338_08975 [Roseinatronobacter sp.]
MARNIKTALGRRQSPMSQFDRLPPDLRQWLATAILPWSVHSVLKHWNAALHCAQGNTDQARARLSQIEARCIARDAAHIWGDQHPAAAHAPTARRTAQQLRP